MIWTGIGLFFAAVLGHALGHRAGFVHGARYVDALWQRRIAQWNETARRAQAPKPQPQGRVLFPGAEMDDEAAAVAVRLLKRISEGS